MGGCFGKCCVCEQKNKKPKPGKCYRNNCKCKQFKERGNVCSTCGHRDDDHIPNDKKNWK